MEISGKEYQEYIDKLSRIIFTSAISEGTNDYDQNIYDMINTNVDILDVVFPNHNNYSAITLSIQMLEIRGVTLTVNHDVMSTNELFEFEDPNNENQ